MKRSELPYGTEIGSQLVKVDLNQFGLYKEKKLNTTDKHYSQRIDEIREQIVSLLEEKQWNDIIWMTLKFEPHESVKIHLYQKENGDYITTIIGPDEWRVKYEHIGKFVLSSQSNTFKMVK
jgi:hypothetical protein